MQHIKKIALVGFPNVGKSSVFNALSGRYVTVSNYPGTTVEVFRAKIHLGGNDYEIVDTPGMYSLIPLSEEERIARLMLLQEKPDVVLHIAEAKNLERNLTLTLQLIEAGFCVLLVLNIMDEAQKEGMHIDIQKLQRLLGIGVVATVAVRNKGIRELKEKIMQAEAPFNNRIMQYQQDIEALLDKITAHISSDYTITKREVALLLLHDDEDAKQLVYRREDRGHYESIQNLIEKELSRLNSQPIEYTVNIALVEKARLISRDVILTKVKQHKKLVSKLNALTVKPIVGIPLLFLFLYFGLYKMVGEFGAGTLVDFLEDKVFTSHINPFFISLFNKFVPFSVIRMLFVGEYGIITLGIRYAVAIVLPIVGVFFLVFSFAEDTGYLPRLGAMLDNLFKKIGLSGKAVIPIVLGLGCDTMATIATRTLATKRERLIATFLLSLSVPCSAQLGVLMAVLAKRRLALIVWFATISAIFAISGWLLNKILKGKRPSFYLELPPLRLPRFDNIFVKTYMRLKWYFKEVLPLFVWASIFIWLGQITGIFSFLTGILAYVIKFIGLPKELASVFLFGFFRRDYGAAGLYDLNDKGLLSVREIIISAVVLTLFLPCIAQFLMNIKERGVRIAFAITVFVLLFSFSVGFVLNKILLSAGVW